MNRDLRDQPLNSNSSRPVQLLKLIASACLGLYLVLTSATATAASTPEEAVLEAVEQNGGAGKVLSVREKKASSGEGYFQVKLLQSGKVRIFKIEKN